MVNEVWVQLLHNSSVPVAIKAQAVAFDFSRRLDAAPKADLAALQAFVRELDEIGRTYPQAEDLVYPGGDLDSRLKRASPEAAETWARTVQNNPNAPFAAYHGSGLEIVGILTDQLPLEKIADFLHAHEIAWPQYYDGKADEVAKRFSVRAYPTVMVVDKTGIVTAYARGEALEAEVKRLFGP